MGLFEQLERERRAMSYGGGPVASPSPDIVSVFQGGAVSTAGALVTEQTALAQTTVLACVRVLAESVAQLPLHVYKRLERGRARDVDHPVYRLLHDRPNPELTSFHFREVLQAHLGLRGNAYAEIEYTKGGRPIALWPLPPQAVRPFRQDGVKRYAITLASGGQETLEADRVLHIAGFGYDGLQGFTPIALLRNAIGLAIATEEFGARFFSNGSRPGGVLTRPAGAPKMSDQARKNLKESWENVQGGLSNSHRVALLEEGMDWKQIGLAPEDSQFLETRTFQRREIASWYRVPLHMIADLERATFSNIEQQSTEFVTYTLGPWLARWEAVLNHDLFTEEERAGHYAEFLVSGLLRGDAAARSAYYNTRFMIGTLSQNDIREMENENPIDGGDRYFVQGAMVPLDQIGAAAPSPTAESPAARAMGPLLADLARRTISREAHQAERLAKRGAADVAAFYAGDVRTYLAGALAPVCTTFAALGGPSTDPTTLATRAAELLHETRGRMTDADRIPFLARALADALELAA